MDLKPLARRIPAPIRQMLLRGKTGDTLRTLQKQVQKTTSATVETPAGDITLSVFDTWRRLDEMHPSGEYEPILMNALLSEFSNETVYYDVGSRWGIFTSFALVSGVREENIHGFEVDNHSFQLLKDNHIDNDIHLTNAAVGDGGEGSVSLDEYASNYPPPTVMKIDTEGAEFRILEGAESILDPSDLTLFVEVHPSYLQKFGDGKEDVHRLLSEAGFNLNVCLENRSEYGTWHPPSTITLPDDGDYLLRAD